MHTEPHGHAKSPGNKEAPRRTKVPGQSKAQRHAKAPRHAEAPGHTETLRHAKAPGHRSTRTCKKLLMFKSIRLFGSTRTHRSTKMLNHQDTRKQAPGHAKVPGYTYALIMRKHQDTVYLSTKTCSQGYVLKAQSRLQRKHMYLGTIQVQANTLLSIIYR